ncbi:MAG TPA: iron-containing redox enzyme family protein [Pyrinomonadaceae bacterium]|nr:iron-containing redox enzyme family protein [Pyrinomonadaceae bacterium]
MFTRSTLEAEYRAQSEAFAHSRAFLSLEEGRASRQDYDSFIAGVCRTHLKSPQILAFLYSVAPPAVADLLRHNMLEELGLDEAGVSHPALLLQLAEQAGFSLKAQRALEAEAQGSLRRMCTDPILYGTFKEVGLGVLLEVTCFEWMLSKLASRIARFLCLHRQLSEASLQWFSHHSEVDLRHAEEGLDAVIEYLTYYEFDAFAATSILEITFRENPFLKRYFGESLLLETTALAVA